MISAMSHLRLKPQGFEMKLEIQVSMFVVADWDWFLAMN